MAKTVQIGKRIINPTLTNLFNTGFGTKNYTTHEIQGVDEPKIVEARYWLETPETPGEQPKITVSISILLPIRKPRYLDYIYDPTSETLHLLKINNQSIKEKEINRSLNPKELEKVRALTAEVLKEYLTSCGI